MRQFLLAILLTILRRDSELAQDIRCSNDLHDWYDDFDKTKYPPHMGDEYTCERCGRDFTV